MTDDALLSTPGRTPYTGELDFHPDDDHHGHYQQFRQEHERTLDDDYAAYRRHRFASEFEGWRTGRQERIAPEHESPLRSFGRAISETVTGARDPSPDAVADAADRPLDGGTQREATERFFERG